MRISFQRLDPRTNRFRIERDGHAPICCDLETRSLLLHDFAHYAYEDAVDAGDGFYGRLYQGASLDELRDPALAPALMEVEQGVAMLQSAFKRGEFDHIGAGRLRQLWGAWQKIRQDQALVVRWPPGEPRLVEVTRARPGSASDTRG
ncbi:MAG: hypothetical protein AAGE52_31250 [Myxococcota bacterium]